MRHFIAVVFLAHGLAFGLLSLQAVARGYADQVVPLAAGASACIAAFALMGGFRRGRSDA